MSGYIDLHCHYLPGVDDGVRTAEEGLSLCRGLWDLGYRTAVATPHIRTATFDNDCGGLERVFNEFKVFADEKEKVPELLLAAEHYFDDVFWRRFRARETLPYPGGNALLLELPPELMPVGLERRLFEMSLRKVRPVLAHPERYSYFFRSSEAMDPLLDMGVLPLLDLMALVGRYGRRPQESAERLLEEGVYFAACSDSHRASDLPLVGEAIERLCALVGEGEAVELLADNPRRILEGRFD